MTGVGRVECLPLLCVTPLYNGEKVEKEIVMGQSVRAVYENGLLRPLETINLQEGEEVDLIFQSERDKFRAAMGDLLVEWTETSDELDESMKKP